MTGIYIYIILCADIFSHVICRTQWQLLQCGGLVFDAHGYCRRIYYYYYYYIHLHCAFGARVVLLCKSLGVTTSQLYLPTLMQLSAACWGRVKLRVILGLLNWVALLK